MEHTTDTDIQMRLAYAGLVPTGDSKIDTFAAALVDPELSTQDKQDVMRRFASARTKSSSEWFSERR